MSTLDRASQLVKRAAAMTEPLVTERRKLGMYSNGQLILVDTRIDGALLKDESVAECIERLAKRSAEELLIDVTTADYIDIEHTFGIRSTDALGGAVSLWATATREMLVTINGKQCALYSIEWKN